jgi:hypothetical protein
MARSKAFLRRKGRYTPFMIITRSRILISFLILPFLCYLVVQQAATHLFSRDLKAVQNPLAMSTLSDRSQNHSYWAALGAGTGLGQRAALSESNGRRLTTELQDAGYPLTTPLTIILPVSLHTMNQLERVLLTLLEEYNVVEVVLLCHSASLSVFRNKLRALVSRELWDDSRLQLLLRPHNGNVVEETLQASRDAVGQSVLVLGEDLLGNLSFAGPKLLNSSFTANPSLLLQGSCTGGSPHSFLTPPFLVPVTLMQQEVFLDDLRTWKAFSDVLALARWDRFGDIMILSENINGWHTWCSLISKDEQAVLEYGNDDFNLLPGNVLSEHGYLNGGNDSEKSGHFGLVLPFKTDLAHFSSAVCRLLANDYTVDILLRSDEVASRATNTDTLQTEACDLPYTILPQSTPAWFDDSAHLYDVIILTENDELLIDTRRDLRTTVILIPREDLPYCDWTGTLSLDEWLSVYLTFARVIYFDCKITDWYTPSFEISIITNNRPKSLSRLFESLTNARYFGDTVSIRVNIDQTSDYETLSLVDGIARNWTRGSTFILHRVVRAGLLPAVVESWYPRSNDSYGILLEDDVEVSPLFYAWAKFAVLRYR